MKKFVKKAFFGVPNGTIAWFIVKATRGINSADREWYIDEKDRAEVVATMAEFGEDIWNLRIGNCGWAKAPEANFVRFACSQSTYADLCEKINEKKIVIHHDNYGY